MQTEPIWVVMGVRDSLVVMLYAGTSEEVARREREYYFKEREARNFEAVILLKQEA